MAVYNVIVAAVLLLLAACVQPGHAKCGRMIRGVNWDGCEPRLKPTPCRSAIITISCLFPRRSLPPRWRSHGNAVRTFVRYV